MPFDRFMIGPPEGGLQSDVKPWLIADGAFSELTNAYVFRGRVRKRFGSYLINTSVNIAVAQLSSRLRINVATTAVTTGNLTSTTMPGLIWAIGQQFSVGNTIFTVYQASGATLTTGLATATYDTSNGHLVITGNGENPSTIVYFYPSTPVMGLISYETDVINDEPVYAFDTQFAYFYTGGTTGSWQRLGTKTWTGTDSQFFWGYTYRGITNAEQFLYVTNNNPPDRIAYWDGTNWNTIAPIVNNTNRIYTAKIIVPFKNRLVFLNVTEGNEGTTVGTTDANTGNFSGTIASHTYLVGQSFVVGTTTFTILTAGNAANPMASTTASTATFNTVTFALVITGNGLNGSTPIFYLPGTGGTLEVYHNRARFSQDGDPTAVNAWEEIVPGKGGYVDAPTTEQIISAEFLKDRLIVYFERSTWELAYTGNTILPFIWQQINTELGCQSTFSIIPFDKAVLGIGNSGIHACNGSNVQRIDQKIPDEVFELSSDVAVNGPMRTYGIRDYFVEQVYWSVLKPNINNNYPNKVLVYNYPKGTWAFNDDSITAFGYFQDQSNETWDANPNTWDEESATWNDASLTANFKQIIAGNQQGFIFIIDSNRTRNAQALQITNISFVASVVTLTIINHNLTEEDYILIENVDGITGLNGNIYPLSRIDTNTISIIQVGVAGTYTGAGTISRVSNINIETKQYNFYAKDGYNTYFSKVDCLVDKTTSGQITVDSFVSSSEESQLEEGLANGATLGTGILETSPYVLVPFENTQVRIWHPVYLQSEGECIQLQFTLKHDEITNPAIAHSDFQLHAMTFYCSPTSSRLQ